MHAITCHKLFCWPLAELVSFASLGICWFFSAILEHLHVTEVQCLGGECFAPHLHFACQSEVPQVYLFIINVDLITESVAKHSPLFLKAGGPLG